MCKGESTSNFSTIATFRIKCPKCRKPMKNYKLLPILQVICNNPSCLIFNKIYIINQPNFLIKREIGIKLNCVGTAL